MKKGIRVLSVKETNVVAKNIKKKLDAWNKNMRKKL